MPAFSRVTIRPSSGGVTRIVRVGTGVHVAGASLDGAGLGSTWLALGRHRPGTISVFTTDAAQPGWGTGPQQAPPSFPSR